MAKQNFKELSDGRYRLTVPEDIRQILISALAAHGKDFGLKSHESCLLYETLAALNNEVIKLRKSEFFLLFSQQVQVRVPETTQNYINALLNLDEVKRSETMKLYRERQRVHSGNWIF
jgi:hypothetical protein